MVKTTTEQDLDILDEIVVDTILSTAKHQFDAIVGQVYYLYARADSSYFISLVEPKYWDTERFNLRFIANVVYTQNQTWIQTSSSFADIKEKKK